MQAELSTELIGKRPAVIDTDALKDRAKGLVIRNNTDYLQACEIEKKLKAKIAEISQSHEKRKGLAHQLHKLIVAEEKEDQAPYELALKVVKPKRIAFEEEEERKRKEEQRRRDAEQKRLDEERRLAEAEKLEAEGHAKEAERVLERQEPQTRVHVPVDLPKSGIAKLWYYGWIEEESTLLELVEAAVKDHRLLAYLDWNRKNINSHVRDNKDMANVPGVKTWKERR